KQAELQQTNDAATVADPRKTAVEADIARAKARKLEQQQANAKPEERLTRAKPPSKPLLPVPKRANWNSNRLMRSQKNRLIRAKRQLPRLLPAFRPKKPPSKRL
ncbi:electron transport complex subunit RsxC, partial [Escherichia coli]